MCTPQTALDQTYRRAQEQLADAGLLIRMGVPGLYGVSGTFEAVIEAFEAHITRASRRLMPEVLRFPPVFNRDHYLRTSHIENFPDLLGSIHCFTGNEREHTRMLLKREAGEDWTAALTPSELMMTPAICYPLYPTATGTLPADGRLVDLRGWAFRHEPAQDPARMQSFRMREFVRLGTPEQALAHREEWLQLSQEILRPLELDVRAIVAHDPFFGRSGRVMAAAQTEQVLKFELVTTVASCDVATAIASCNYHLDYFGKTFDIETVAGQIAHSACVGFGLERTALALFFRHGFDPDLWPSAVKQTLGL